MKIYLAIKFHPDFSNRELIENLSVALGAAGHTSVVAVRDLEGWGAIKLTNKELMDQDFKAVGESDMLLVEFSEKGVGIGIAVGFAKALNKPIVVIAKTGSEISSTLEGTADKIVFYDKPEDLIELFKTF